MKDFLLGLLYLVIVVVVLRFLGKLLIKWVYMPLERLCHKKGLNPSPWGFTIWEALLIYEYANRTAYELFFQYWKLTRWMSAEGYGWFVLGLIALPLLVMLVQAKGIYFIPLLFTKLVGIPFFLIGFLCGMPATPKEDLEELEYDEHGLRRYPVRAPGYRSPDPGQTPVPGGSGGAPEYSGSEPTGPYWATPDSGDLPSAGSSEPHISRDGYQRFDAQGEYREVDSDYTPMDS